MKNKTILVTGASGVIGQALCAKVEATLPDLTLICLVHCQTVSGPNIIPIPSDITEPNLGLSDKMFHDLSKRVDGIIHSAAITDFNRPLDELRRHNVDGVRHMLAFAAEADVPLLHVSTAFVQARSGYQLNNYERSKLEAEQIIHQSDVPAAIVRPSVVIGDSRTGVISKMQGIHRMIRLLLKETMPVVPGSPNSLIDFIPQDYVADVLLGLLEQGITKGDYWITAGEDAVSFGEAVDLLAEHASMLMGRTLTKPRIMKPAAFDRLIRPVFLPMFPKRQQQIFEESLAFLKYMNMEEPFPSSSAQLQQLNIAKLPDLRHTLRQSLGYIIRYTNERRPRERMALQQETVKP